MEKAPSQYPHPSPKVALGRNIEGGAKEKPDKGIAG